MSKNFKRNCDTCKFGIFDQCDTLKNHEQYQNIEDDGIKERFTRKLEFKKGFICDNYNSIYIEYPIEVSRIDKDTNISGYKNNQIGKLVKIRPCAKEYQDKTYLGLYLGELPVDFIISHTPKTKELSVKFDTNPAIFVPDLGKIIYGRESWWSVIEDESQLKDISDEDIDNVWYVKIGNSMLKKERGDDI